LQEPQEIFPVMFMADFERIGIDGISAGKGLVKGRGNQKTNGLGSDPGNRFPCLPGDGLRPQGIEDHNSFACDDDPAVEGRGDTQSGIPVKVHVIAGLYLPQSQGTVNFL